ncbi:hypothetical protein HGRIS_004220 [Hohenbuehelia grisea]|uniref:Uncharacterized protein n=1 Tax=Hohenbuehelia grisea TaxID=104357 RepID=A0ABR3JIU5_9AGAR
MRSIYKAPKRWWEQRCHSLISSLSLSDYTVASSSSARVATDKLASSPEESLQSDSVFAGSPGETVNPATDQSGTRNPWKPPLNFVIEHPHPSIRSNGLNPSSYNPESPILGLKVYTSKSTPVVVNAQLRNITAQDGWHTVTL